MPFTFCERATKSAGGGGRYNIRGKKSPQFIPEAFIGRYIQEKRLGVKIQPEYLRCVLLPPNQGRLFVHNLNTNQDPGVHKGRMQSKILRAIDRANDNPGLSDARRRGRNTEKECALYLNIRG